MFNAAQKLAYAKQRIRRGTVCHWRQPFGPHFAVVLNLEWPPADDEVLFSIATSQITKFSSFLDPEIIRIVHGAYSCITRPTVLDLRNVYVAKLSAIVAQPEFSIECELSADHMRDLDEILRKSETVEQILLDRIVS